MAVFPNANIITAFPKINSSNASNTSDATWNYNCIAWAYGYSDRRMWPNLRSYWWPKNIGQTESINSFVELFSLQGYKVCPCATHEHGFEKVAIYAKPNDEPTHAARELESGKWTSKLGKDIDIQHDDPYVLEGPTYGKVAVIMKRARPETDTSGAMV